MLLGRTAPGRAGIGAAAGLRDAAAGLGANEGADEGVIAGLGAGE